MLEVEWEEESEPCIEVLFDEVDISEGYISFAIADTRMDTEELAEAFNYTVTLTDVNGNTVSVSAPQFIYHTIAVQLYKQDVLFGSYEYKPQLQRVVVAPEVFGQSGQFDFTAVTGITITTNGTEAGSFIIDRIGYEVSGNPV